MTKEEAIKVIDLLPNDVDIIITTSPKYISCSQVEALGISRQLLGYHVKLGDIKSTKNGRYKKYLLEDVLKLV